MIQVHYSGLSHRASSLFIDQFSVRCSNSSFPDVVFVQVHYALFQSLFFIDQLIVHCSQTVVFIHVKCSLFNSYSLFNFIFITCSDCSRLLIILYKISLCSRSLFIFQIQVHSIVLEPLSSSEFTIHYLKSSSSLSFFSTVRCVRFEIPFEEIWVVFDPIDVYRCPVFS